MQNKIKKDIIIESILRVGSKNCENHKLFDDVAFAFFDDNRDEKCEKFTILVKKDLMETLNLDSLDLSSNYITAICEYNSRKLGNKMHDMLFPKHK